MMWTGNKQDQFSVKSANGEFITSNNQIGCCSWKMIWRVKIPYKAASFRWLLAEKKKEAVLAHDNLSKRGYHHMYPDIYLCGE